MMVGWPAAAAQGATGGAPEQAWGTWIFLIGVWAVSAALAGLGLAVFARRIHPSLSFVRLWIFYAFLTAFLAAVVFLVGLF